MTALTIRPSSWDLALFVHVAGAMLVVAALVVAVSVLGLAWRAEGDERRKLTRFGFLTLLCAAIPAYIMMRTGAQWVLSKEGLDDSEAAWVPDDWKAIGTEMAAAPLWDPDTAVIVGRPGGPAMRDSEVARLAHLAGLTSVVTGRSPLSIFAD